jgi:hypothetical protein
MEVEWSGIRILIEDLWFSDGLSIPVVWFKYRIDSDSGASLLASFSFLLLLIIFHTLHHLNIVFVRVAKTDWNHR